MLFNFYKIYSDIVTNYNKDVAACLYTGSDYSGQFTDEDWDVYLNNIKNCPNEKYKDFCRQLGLTTEQVLNFESYCKQKTKQYSNASSVLLQNRNKGVLISTLSWMKFQLKKLKTLTIDPTIYLGSTILNKALNSITVMPKKLWGALPSLKFSQKRKPASQPQEEIPAAVTTFNNLDKVFEATRQGKVFLPSIGKLFAATKEPISTLLEKHIAKSTFSSSPLRRP